eukprot:5886152-Amphidinium_carterae.1
MDCACKNSFYAASYAASSQDGSVDRHLACCAHARSAFPPPSHCQWSEAGQEISCILRTSSSGYVDTEASMGWGHQAKDVANSMRDVLTDRLPRWAASHYQWDLNNAPLAQRPALALHGTHDVAEYVSVHSALCIRGLQPRCRLGHGL